MKTQGSRILSWTVVSSSHLCTTYLLTLCSQSGKSIKGWRLEQESSLVKSTKETHKLSQRDLLYNDNDKN